MTFEKRRILITSGGTFEKWDNIRGHTNLSKGIIGMYLTEVAVQSGFEVILLHGLFTKFPELNPNVVTYQFTGIDDLFNQIKALLATTHFDAVIMGAAVTDWVIEKITDNKGNVIGGNGKISSDIEPVLYLKRAPKIIAEIKNIQSNLKLVGFKLESTRNENELVERAFDRLEKWRADIVVANADDSLQTEVAAHYLIYASGETRKVNNKREAATEVMKALISSMK